MGLVSFVVRLSDPGGGAKIRDADVSLELTHAETGTTLTHVATHADSGNPVDFAAHVQFEQAGQWRGVLRVNGPAGPIEVPFLQRVLPERQLSTLIFIGIPFLAILGLLGAIWFMRSGAQQRRST